MKKILILTILVSMFCTLSAQRRNYRTVDVFNNNVELSISGGVNALHLWREKPFNKLSDELTPMIQFSVGYQFSPILGTRIAVQGGNTKSVLPITLDPYYDTILHNSLVYTHADLLVNITNFWRTKAKKKYYDATIIFGAGFVTLRPEESKDQFSGFAMNGGLINSFYLNRNLLLNIEAKLLIPNDIFSTNYHLNYEGWAMNYDVSLGFSYKIATDQKHKRYTGRRR